MAKRDVGSQPETRIGARVCFGAPQDVAKKGGGAVWGKVLDEIWVPESKPTPESTAAPNEYHWGAYIFCAQRIAWDEGGESIRLGYWRRRAGEAHWEFASQTTVTSDPSTIAALLRATLAKSEWFPVELPGHHPPAV